MMQPRTPTRRAERAGRAGRTGWIGLAGLLGPALMLLLLPAGPAHGRGSKNRPAWLGTAVTKLTRLDRRQKGVPKHGGVLVQRVVKGSPAARTGLRAGDVLMRLDNKYVYTPAAVIERVAAKGAGDKLKIDIIRNGQWMTAKVRLEPRPSKYERPRLRPRPRRRARPRARRRPAPRDAKDPFAGRRPAARRPAGDSDDSDDSDEALRRRIRTLEKQIRLLKKLVLQVQRRCKR